VKEVEQRTVPKPKRRQPLLAQLQPPSPLPSEDASSSIKEAIRQQRAESSEVLPTNDHLSFPADELSVASESSFTSLVPTLIPSTLPSKNVASTAISTAATQRFPQSSTAIQQELSEQLAQMATQLKRNATHFSESLAKDKGVVEEMQHKLERNLDVMQKERLRLRDHRSKSKSTTCLVVGIIMTVLLLFMIMVYVIRFT